LGSADAQVTLRVVPSSDLKILDPIYTPAYITRNHGYLIYDTPARAFFSTTMVGTVSLLAQQAPGHPVHRR
jgi:hypothetical protein